MTKVGEGCHVFVFAPLQVLSFYINGEIMSVLHNKLKNEEKRSAAMLLAKQYYTTVK